MVEFNSRTRRHGINCHSDVFIFIDFSIFPNKKLICGKTWSKKDLLQSIEKLTTKF